MDEQGPNPEGLRQLAQAMPELIKAAREGKIKAGGNGKAIRVKRTQPRKLCPVCATPWDIAAVDQNTPLKPENCEDCAKLLNEGNTALVCGDFYAFADFRSVYPELAGEIVHMEPPQMEQIKEKFQVDLKKRQSDESARQD